MRTIYSICLAAVLALVGCSKPVDTDVYKVVPRSEIANLITNQYGWDRKDLHVDISQANYAVPVISWVSNSFTPAFGKFLSANGLTHPREPDNNCQKFTSYGSTAAYIQYLNNVHPTNATLAVGEFEYLIGGDIKRGHSINLFIVHKDGKLIAMYYDPQLGHEVEIDWTDFPLDIKM